jgi:hypothetical protein
MEFYDVLTGRSEQTFDTECMTEQMPDSPVLSPSTVFQYEWQNRR